ncbi:MAG: transporter substrate-binding domain-containing protein [Desulfovibrionaceae bacterium]|nr:transporter substrate-binding domain-containing protein [Desulfovibrionaceae bacterium]
MRKFILCLLFMVFLSPGLAASANIEEVYVGELSPLIVIDAHRGIHGSAVEIVSTIMDMADNTLTAGDFKDIIWARALETVKSHSGTAIICLARTPQRERIYKWVGPVGEVVLGLYAQKNRNMRFRPEDESPKSRIGVVRGSAAAHILLNSCGMEECDLRFVKDDETQFKMLKKGRLDLITQSDTGALLTMKKLGFDSNEFEMVHVLDELKLYLALNIETDDAFVSRLQAALDGLKQPDDDGNSRFDAIRAKYRK